MLVQVYVDDIIFGSTNKSWCDKFEAVMLKKFALVNVKAAITPMETKLPLTKDEEAFDVDVHFPLGKFDGKSDEGFLVGYSVNSKAFRVYNLVTKRVEVNLHVNFLEEKPNRQGLGHRWMFDLDYLTDSMNYIPVSLQNQANPAGSKEVIDIDVQTEEDAYLMVVSSTSLSKKIATKKTHSLRQPSSTPISKSADDIVPTSTNPVNTGSSNLNTAFEEVNTGNT
ncbi:hypothetical protein Tco_0081648, partial [Tanacetum coccineum]